MEEQAAKDYSKFFDVDLETKLIPLNQKIDEMLVRLEEFETMVALAQQERCNAMGITGALTEVIDVQKDLTSLCSRIDTVGKLIEHIKSNVNTLESKIETAEEQFGIGDGSNMLKSFFLPLFKKHSDKPTAVDSEHTLETLDLHRYFVNESTVD